MIKDLFYIITLIFVFYTFGLIISNIVNFIFPDSNFKKQTKYIFFECLIQFTIVYGFFFIFNTRIRKIVEIIFKNVTNKKLNNLITTIIIIAFSSGVFKHFDHLNIKVKYLKNLFFQ